MGLYCRVGSAFLSKRLQFRPFTNPQQQADGQLEVSKSKMKGIQVVNDHWLALLHEQTAVEIPKPDEIPFSSSVSNKFKVLSNLEGISDV